MTVPVRNDPGSLVATPRPEAPGTWWLAWSVGSGRPFGFVWEGTVDELSGWAMANGFTGVEVRPSDHA